MDKYIVKRKGPSNLQSELHSQEQSTIAHIDAAIDGATSSCLPTRPRDSTKVKTKVPRLMYVFNFHHHSLLQIDLVIYYQ